MSNLKRWKQNNPHAAQVTAIEENDDGNTVLTLSKEHVRDGELTRTFDEAWRDEQCPDFLVAGSYLIDKPDGTSFLVGEQFGLFSEPVPDTHQLEHFLLDAVIGILRRLK